MCRCSDQSHMNIFWSIIILVFVVTFKSIFIDWYVITFFFACPQMESAAQDIHENMRSVVDYQTHHRLREAQVGQAIFLDIYFCHPYFTPYHIVNQLLLTIVAYW